MDEEHHGTYIKLWGRALEHLNRYIVKRLLQLVAVLFGITFLLTYLSPGESLSG